MANSIKALTILNIIIVTLLFIFVLSEPALAMQDSSHHQILAHAKALDLISDDSIVLDEITREQVIYLLVKAFSGEDYQAASLDNLKESGFYQSYLYSAAEMGLINEFTSQSELEGFISNQEGLSLLAISAGIRTNDFDPLRTIVDNEEISTYAKPYLSALVEGEFAKVTDGHIYPAVNAKLIDYLEVIENVLYNKYIAD